MIKSFERSVIFHEEIYFNSSKSYYPEETIKLYGLRDNNIGSHLEITSLGGEKIIDEPIEFKTGYKEKINPQKGYPEFKIKDLTLNRFKPGIYIINNQHYFVVKGKEKTSITFIVPSLSTICTDTSGGYSLLNENQKTECASISALKPVKIDDYTLQLNNLIQLLPDNITINFCTDFDFQNKNNIPESNVYVLYGNPLFSTPEILSNVNQKILNGAHFILLTSYTLNNKVFFNKKNNTIDVCDTTSNSGNLKAYSKEDTLSNIDVFCANYTFGGNTVSLSFPQKMQALPDYINNSSDHLPIFADLWIGAKDTSKVDYWYSTPTKYRESNTTGGIFTYKPTDTSGTIYHLGTASWLEKSNLETPENQDLILSIFKHLSNS